MTHSQQAVQDYINNYGRVNIDDMNKFFGSKTYRNKRDGTRTGTNQFAKIFNKVFKNKRVSFPKYSSLKREIKHNIEFEKLKEISRFIFEMGFEKVVNEVIYFKKVNRLKERYKSLKGDAL